MCGFCITQWVGKFPPGAGNESWLIPASCRLHNKDESSIHEIPLGLHDEMLQAACNNTILPHRERGRCRQEFALGFRTSVSEIISALNAPLACKRNALYIVYTQHPDPCTDTLPREHSYDDGQYIKLHFWYHPRRGISATIQLQCALLLQSLSTSTHSFSYPSLILLQVQDRTTRLSSITGTPNTMSE